MCDIQTAIKNLGSIGMDFDRECVQMVAIAGLTVLGSVAIIFDGEIGMTIAIGVAGGIGYLARSLFPGGRKNETKKV